MTSTRLLAARVSERLDAPIPPEVWLLFINAAVQLLMQCFAQTGPAAEDLRRQRVGWLSRRRLYHAALRAGIPKDQAWNAVYVLLDESARATSGELAALYHDQLLAAIETGEFPATKG